MANERMKRLANPSSLHDQIVGETRYPLSEETNVSPHVVGQSSCARQNFNPKTLLRMSYKLLHGGAHKFPRTKLISSPQQQNLVNGD